MSELRGSLIDKPEEIGPQLKGSLLERAERYSDQWFLDNEFTNRDDGKPHKVVQILNEGKTLQLAVSGELGTINLNKEEFIKKLETSGSAWTLKKE